MKRVLLLSIACLVSACSPEGAPDGENGAAAPAETAGAGGVVTSGKTEVPVSLVPEAVIAAARAEQSGLTITEAESETRDGRRYYDIGAIRPGGGEIEFDIMEENGTWRVVETQQDIAFAEAPEAVRAAHTAEFRPTRVIESRQADGLVIYELFGEVDGNPEGRKVEIRWDGTSAQVLEEEWAH